MNGVARPQPLGESGLDGFQDGQHPALVVDRAATPDELRVHHAREGRMSPPGGIVRGHHVLVREQDRGRPRGVGAPPGVEAAVPETFELQFGVHPGKRPLEVRAEPLELGIGRRGGAVAARLGLLPGHCHAP